MLRSPARTFTLLGLFLGLLLHSTAYAEAHFTARLSGAQENPAVVTPARGSAFLVLTTAGVQFFVTVEGLSGPITACHIHRGAAGVNGPVVRTLTGNLLNQSAYGEWTATDPEPLTAALIDELLRGDLYVNFHTAANPGGEIRGQIVVSGGAHFTAQLNGTQENPALAVPGTGTGTFTLTEEALVYKITVNALSGAITASHFHTGAIGVNGPVTITITPSFVGTTATGTVVLTPVQRRDLLTGNLYVNVHTAANPGGEIRGQVQLAGGFGFSAFLRGGNEVPPNASPGSGTASVTVTPSGLIMNLTVTALSGPIAIAHIHRGPPGVNGPIVRTITGDFVTPTTALTLWRADDPEPFTPAMMSELLNGNLYANVHTAAFGGGEIRSQLLLNQPSATPGVTFTATMTGAQEEPSVVTGARGTGTLRLTPAGVEFTITVDGLSGPITAAHFHNAGIGRNGGVVRTLTGNFVGNTASGIWTPADPEALTPALITALFNSQLYLNAHTALNPGGEIRGQVLLSSGADLEARLTAQQEVPVNASTALGTGSFTLTSEGLAFSVTVDGLSGPMTAAHFHRGAPGVNGPVVRTITEFGAGNTAIGVWKPTDAQPLIPALVTELLKGDLYFNVHTALNPGGEIRGRVQLAGGDGREAVLAAGNEVGPVVSLGLGSAAMTLTDQGHVFRLSANDLTSALTAAHFHNAPMGVNGPVVRTITGDFINLTADGVWKPSDAEPLTTALIAQMFLDNIYLNLHTVNNPGGEIRGQTDSYNITGVEDPVLSGPLRLTSAPNPARNRTSFSFLLPRDADVSLDIFDLSGRQVANVLRGPTPAGWHHAAFTTGSLKAGVYFYRLRAGSLSQSRKMLIAR